MQPLPLYKIVKMWFLPPGIFVVALLLLACYLGHSAYVASRRKESAAKALKVSCGITLFLGLLLYGLSVNAIAQRLMHSLEYQYQRVEAKVDAIVCISGDFEWEREKATAKLYKKHKVPVLMSGYNYDIASKMAKLGLPKDKITVDKAFDTKENVQFTLPVIKAKGYKKVYLVSSANHMPRSMMNFEKAYRNNGIEVVAWPVGYYTTKNHRKEQLEYVPDIRFFSLANRACHEYVGMLELWLDRFCDGL